MVCAWLDLQAEVVKLLSDEVEHHHRLGSFLESARERLTDAVEERRGIDSPSPRSIEP